MIMFLFVTSFPLLFELWMETTFREAVMRIFTQYITLSPLHFIFQAKIIGYYVTNELRYGGAQYVATGRGLPTERRDFVGKPLEEGCGIQGKGASAQGLYLDYTMHTYYSGVWLLFGVCLILLAGGVHEAGPYSGGLFWTFVCLGLTITSWLLAPFIFNPYMFSPKCFWKDVRAWFGFFFSQDGGMLWVDWYTSKQIKPKQGAAATRPIFDLHLVLAFFGILVIVSALQEKLRVLTLVGDPARATQHEVLEIVALLPPVSLSFAYCMLV